MNTISKSKGRGQRESQAKAKLNSAQLQLGQPRRAEASAIEAATATVARVAQRKILHKSMRTRGRTTSSLLKRGAVDVNSFP